MARLGQGPSPSQHALGSSKSSNEGEETLIPTYRFHLGFETDLKLMTKHCTSLKVLPRFPSQCSVRHSLDGLLCIVEYCSKMRVFVSNLLTGTHLSLPLPPALSRSIRIGQFGLGFDSSIRKYKIVCAYFRDIDRANRRYGLGAQVCTIGAPGSDSWREIVSQPPVPINGDEQSAYASGVRHWLVDYHYNPNHLETMVISFDFEKEEFKTIPRQEFFSYRRGRADLVDLRGYFGMVDLSQSTSVEIWRLKDYDKNEWVKEHRLAMLPPTYCCIDVVGLMGQDELVFLTFSMPDNRTLDAAVAALDLKAATWRVIYRFANLEMGARGRVFLHRASLVSLFV